MTTRNESARPSGKVQDPSATAEALRKLRQVAGLAPSAERDMIDIVNPAESFAQIADEARRSLLTEQIALDRFFPFVLRCMTTSQNIHGAVRCMVDISASITSSAWTRLWLEENEDRLVIRWTPFSGDPNKIFIHQLRAVSINLTALNWLSGGKLSSMRADFSYSPLSYCELSALLPYNFSLNSIPSQSISRADADMPVVRSQMDTEEFLTNVSSSSFFGLDRQSSVSSEVFSLVTRDLHLRRLAPSLYSISSILQVSPATLRRKLNADGASFRELRERAINMTAKNLLEQTSATIAEIAEQLGYSDERAFRRAFDDWNGKSPAAYRQGFQHGCAGQEL